jgi:hypothetical protein
MKDAGLNVEETRLGGRTKEFAPRSAEVRGFMGVDRRDEGETMYPMVTRWGAAMRVGAALEKSLTKKYFQTYFFLTAIL